jgi:acid phosphatase class B
MVNIMFCEEVMEVSSQCGSAATRNELDTNMVGSNSPFWNKVASLFHSTDGCDPGTDGVDFLVKVHFEHMYYVKHHETIDPSKHGFFSNEKLRSLWNKIKSDYDHAMVNITKSSNHSSSFTAVAMRSIKHHEA